MLREAGICYLPFDDCEQSSEVRQTLKRWLEALGYEITGGQLEVFPSGNALRLPLQPGFAWLDQKVILIWTREELTTEQALASFLSDLESNACNWAEARSRIESQIIASRALPPLTPRRTKIGSISTGIELFELPYSRGTNRSRSGRKGVNGGCMGFKQWANDMTLFWLLVIISGMVTKKPE